MKKFLKWFSISLGALLVLIIITLALLPFVVDINQFRPKIETAVNEQIRGHFSLGTIKISYWPYLGLSLKDIHLKNRPADFNGSEFIQVGEAAFKIHLKSLYSGKLVASFILNKPSIHLISSGETSNLKAILPPAKKEEPAKPLDLNEIAGNKWLKRVVVEEIGLRDGSVTISNAAKTESKPLIFSPLTVIISDIKIENAKKPIRLLFETLYEKVPVKLTAGIWTDLKAESLRFGEASLMVGRSETQIDFTLNKFKSAEPAFEARIDSNDLDVASLLPLAGLPSNLSVTVNPSFSLKAHGTPKTVEASLVLGLKDTKVSSDNVPMVMKDFELKLAVKGAMKDPSVRGTLTIASVNYNKQYEVSKISSHFGYAAKTASLDDASFSIFDGTVQMKGQMGLGPQGAYDLSLDINDLKLEKATTVMSGTAFFNGSVRGEGLNLPSMQKNMSGQGELKLADGKIHTVNLAGSVLSKEIVSLMEKGLAGRGQVVALPGTQETGTPYKQIYLPFRIQDGRLMIDNMSLENSGYEGNMDGSIGLDKTLDLRGKFALAPDQTASLIPESRIRDFVTNNARLVIPFKITGSFDDPKVRPDEGYVKDLFVNAAKKLIQNAATEALKKNLLPMLPGAPAEPSAIPTEDAAQKATDALKKLF